MDDFINDEAEVSGDEVSSDESNQDEVDDNGSGVDEDEVENPEDQHSHRRLQK